MYKKIKYCLPIIANSVKEAEETILREANNYALLEIWLSTIADLNSQFVGRVSATYPSKLIFVLRHPPLSASKLPTELVEEIFDITEKSDVLFDLDIKLQFEDIQKFHAGRNLITSYHNFEATPAKDELEARLETMRSFKPAIYKIATYCKTESDALRLLQLGLDCKQSGMRVIILGMGKFSAITRIFGTLWSNEFIYAPLELSTSSAPGQLTKPQLEKIFGALNAG